MATYRLVTVDALTGDKVRTLSAEAFRVYLLAIAGPSSTSLPGLLRRGRAGLLEDLFWIDAATAADALGELEAVGLVVVDTQRPTIFLPAVLHDRLPNNPKHAASMAREFVLVPDCAARRAWLQELRGIESKRATWLLEAVDTVSNTVSATVPDTLPHSMSMRESGVRAYARLSENECAPPRLTAAAHATAGGRRR